MCVAKCALARHNNSEHCYNRKLLHPFGMTSRLNSIKILALKGTALWLLSPLDIATLVSSCFLPMLRFSMAKSASIFKRSDTDHC
jgi:hypothetical protein